MLCGCHVLRIRWDKGETVRLLCGVGSAVGENFSATRTVESPPELSASMRRDGSDLYAHNSRPPVFSNSGEKTGLGGGGVWDCWG
ncbi:uncharacterized protein TrAtP1_005529 [Trichoderma atroviride]|uniref:uncharacterized protein n=1 Tax=Hypocrea atroviridis TaxID=63577 RepID=UPI0033235EE1|nr:hypothetical protein TrAtP1_005529 [Trichoderma atroviride]